MNGLAPPPRTGTAARPAAAEDQLGRHAGLIVVLYRPVAADLARWLAWPAGSGQLVMIDNTEQTDPVLQASLRQAGVTLLCNHNQGGLAGAYNQGARWLLARGCRLIFLFDQDSQVDAGYFEAMLAACASLEGQAFLMGPKIYETRLQRFMPVLDPHRRWPRPLSVDALDGGLLPSLCVISSGSVISRAAWQRLGSFREDYFIEYLDIEYALRAWHQQVPVYVNTAASLRQQAGAIVRHGRHYSTHHPAWRRYYMARNAIHALRLYPGRLPLLLGGLLLLLYQAFGVACFESARRDKLKAMGLGLLDGLRGRMGTLERRHPRQAVRWRAG